MPVFLIPLLDIVRGPAGLVAAGKYGVTADSVQAKPPMRSKISLSAGFVQRPGYTDVITSIEFLGP
jgi:hypothetical protein